MRFGRRAAGFLRSLPRLRARAGARGTLELIVARALAGLLSYERVTLIQAPGRADERHPELHPRRVRACDAQVVEFHARLAAHGEPEVPAFSVRDLERRFAAGHVLWTFEAEGTLAHARWTVSDRLRFAGFSVPLEPGEHATEAVLTLPRFRRHGLNLKAREHVRTVLGGEGAVAMLSAINGFNRSFLQTTLGIDGAQRLAEMHVLSLGGRRWYRAVAGSAGAAVLKRGGLRVGGWRREATDPRSTWERAATRTLKRPYLDPRMAAVKQRVHEDLLDRWLPDLSEAAVLKTDLWEEGVAGDELLFTLARRSGEAHGIDISWEAIASASRTAENAGVTARLQQADLCRLPFPDSRMDAIVSTSTLDHLSRTDRPRALAELRRVLGPSGVLVVTCDNADNLGDGLLRLAARAGLVPFPLGPSATLAELRALLVRARFECREHAYLVHGPRVLTTALVRLIRLFPEQRSERGVVRVLNGFEVAGRRAPARLGAFVALRATPAE